MKSWKQIRTTAKVLSDVYCRQLVDFNEGAQHVLAKEASNEPVTITGRSISWYGNRCRVQLGQDDSGTGCCHRKIGIWIVIKDIDHIDIAHAVIVHRDGLSTIVTSLKMMDQKCWIGNVNDIDGIVSTEVLSTSR